MFFKILSATFNNGIWQVVFRIGPPFFRKEHTAWMHALPDGMPTGDKVFGRAGHLNSRDTLACSTTIITKQLHDRLVNYIVHHSWERVSEDRFLEVKLLTEGES